MGENPDDPAPVDEESAVDPEDLDIEDDEYVKSLGDHRYVVSPNDPISDKSNQTTGRDAPSPPATESDRDSDRRNDSDRKPESGDSRAEEVPPSPPKDDSVNVHRARARLTERMIDAKGAYGFDVTAQFGDNVVQQHLQANDVVTVFDALLLWYAEHLDDEKSAEEAIGILLAESDIPVEYPANSLVSLVRAHGLDGSDTVADLVNAACDETVQFPPK
jgi:hypothetical protein